MSRMLWKTIIGFVLALPAQGIAGTFEVSLGFSFNQSNYSGSNYSWTRRWSASVGYYFTERSGIEISFQDVVDRTKIDGYGDTTFHDRVYSANWVQAITGKTSPLQPYFKVGLGQLDREATGSYINGSPNPLVLSLTGVVAVGLRIYVTRSFALRVEGTSYLTGGDISTWQDNVGLNFGSSFYF